MPKVNHTRLTITQLRDVASRLQRSSERLEAVASEVEASGKKSRCFRMAASAQDSLEAIEKFVLMAEQDTAQQLVN